MAFNFQNNNKLQYSYTNLKTRYEFPGYSGGNAQVKRVELNGYNGQTEDIGEFDAATKTYLPARTRYGIVSNDGACPELCVDRWIFPY